MDLRRKKYSLTLLEVLIALSLASILLCGLFTFYTQIAKKQLELKELKRTVMPIELMRQRLNHLFAQAQTEQGDTPRFFYTVSHPDAIGPALFFSYDYGVDPNPAFCGNLKGMLYLNHTHQLCLATWSGQDSRQEIFLEQIESFKLNLFDVKKKQWRHTWEKKDPLPPFFTMTWTTQNAPKEPLTCAFFFPNADSKITYERSR
jgi:hypothetical protein